MHGLSVLVILVFAALGLITLGFGLFVLHVPQSRDEPKGHILRGRKVLLEVNL